MARAYTGISVPAEVLNEIDKVADDWFTGRSKAIVRIFIEWKELRKLATQLPQDTQSKTETTLTPAA